MSQSKRYTAEEMRYYAEVVGGTVADVLLQAAHTESQVAGLVEALEDIASHHGAEFYPLPEWAREALSKFRGEA